MANPVPYHKLPDGEKEVVRAALGYTPNKRDSKQYVVEETERTATYDIGGGWAAPFVWIQYHVYMYEHKHEYIGYFIIEDHVTHWRRRGDSRYDEWETISKA